jgi:hypothetical protein
MMISRPGVRFALALVLAAAFYSTASMAMRDPLPFAEVVSMSKRGDAPSSINAAMRSARTTYALRGSDFGKLAAIGVSPVVLDEIQQSFSDDVDLLTRYWVTGEFMGRCIPCYPQQVDLTGLDSGIAPKTFPPPLRSPFGKPLGLPDWFQVQHYRSNSITVEQVRQMSKAGKSDAEIIAALDAAVLQEAFGPRGSNKSISSNLVAGISGSRLADLRAEGMSDPVLDRLQVSWLGSYVEFLRIRYQSLGKGAQP